MESYPVLILMPQCFARLTGFHLSVHCSRSVDILPSVSTDGVLRFVENPMQHAFRSQSPRRTVPGRYKGVSLAPVAWCEPLKEGIVNAHLEIRHAAVDDPNPALKGRRQRVAVNARTDALEQEYAYHRISEAAYRVGRRYQRTLEKSGFLPNLGRSWQSEPRVDCSRKPDAALVHALQSAQDANAMLAETRPIVGLLGERILRSVLGEGLSLAQTAERMGSGGDLTQSGKGPAKHVIALYAWQFREALEALAEHWTA